MRISPAADGGGQLGLGVLAGDAGVAQAGLVDQVVVAARRAWPRTSRCRPGGRARRRPRRRRVAEGDADARADGGDDALAEDDGDVELRADALDDAGDAVPVDRAVEQDGELVTAEAGGGVGRAQAAAEPVGDRAQQHVAGLVAEGVVDRLEAVEVDVEDRRPHVRARPAMSTACRARSRNSVRLGSPVSGSCSAWWRSCSLRSVTWRRVSSRRPRSREVATCRAKVSSSARSLALKVVTSPMRPPTSSSPCTRSSVRSAAAMASLKPRPAA